MALTAIINISSTDFWIPVRVVGMTWPIRPFIWSNNFQRSLTGTYSSFHILTFWHTILHTFLYMLFYTMTRHSSMYSSLLVSLRTSLRMFLNIPRTQDPFTRPYPSHTLNVSILYTKTRLAFLSLLFVLYPISFFSIKFHL